jgi:hypothetical protein
MSVEMKALNAYVETFGTIFANGRPGRPGQYPSGCGYAANPCRPAPCNPPVSVSGPAACGAANRAKGYPRYGGNCGGFGGSYGCGDGYSLGNCNRVGTCACVGTCARPGYGYGNCNRVGNCARNCARGGSGFGNCGSTCSRPSFGYGNCARVGTCARPGYGSRLSPCRLSRRPSGPRFRPLPACGPCFDGVTQLHCNHRGCRVLGYSSFSAGCFRPHSTCDWPHAWPLSCRAPSCPAPWPSPCFPAWT